MSIKLISAELLSLLAETVKGKINVLEMTKAIPAVKIQNEDQ